MAGSDRAARNGWHHQADRLAVAHTSLGTTVVAAAEQARRRRVSSLYGTDAEAVTEAREIELASELEAARARISGLEKRIAHETATTRALSEQLQVLAPQSEAAEKQILELQNELAAARDGFALHDTSLQTSLDLALGDNSRLSQSVGESNAARDAAQARCEYLESALNAAEAECHRLAGELGTATEKHRAESSTLTARLEAMASRAVTAEKLFADARERLLARLTENSVAERKLADATVACDAAGKKLKQFEAALRSKQRKVDDLEQSRATLIEATNTLLQTVQSRDTALTRAGEEIKILNDRIARLGSRTGADDEHEKMRRNWAELARELARLVKHKRRFSEPGHLRSTSTVLASTFAF
jgi:chromosome segregation ATPase